MRTISWGRFVAPILLFAGALTANAQQEQVTTQKIMQEGKYHSQVMDILRDLTNIGPRLTSSTNLEKAEAYAMAKFKSWGLQNVHLEKWGEFPVGFDRGKCSGGMTAPFAREFEFTTPSWTPGTHGRKEAVAVPAPSTMDEFNRMKGKFKGAWVVYAKQPPRPPRPPRNGETPPELTAEQKDSQAVKAAIEGSGALGIVYPSNNDLVITSGNWQNLDYDKLPTQTQVLIRKSDMDAIQEQMKGGKEVKLAFDINQSFRKGPISNYNVVADIPGTEKPDEIVIVSGHLDSWDGPGSQGALDNGTGSSTCLEAARILATVGARPKRTIRFILWTGEEQGLFGSRGYVRDHPNEMAKISAVLVDDGGTNYQGGYIGIESQREMMESAFAPTVAAFPELPMKFEAREGMPRGGGSDHASFNAVNVPGFFTMETGRSNYTIVHHTQHDKYEMAIPEYLTQSATNHALVSFYLACAPEMLPRQAIQTPPPNTAPAGGGGGK
jgi:hypothetical protein